MKITRASLRPFAVPLERSVPGGRTVTTERRGALLLLEDETGRTGLGELSPLPGFSPDRLEDAVAAARALATRLEGQELPEDDATTLLEAALPDPAGLPASCAAATETALCDLLARRREIPFHELFAASRGSAGRSIPVATLLPASSLREMTDAALAAVGRGVRTLKAKLGPDGEAVELCARLEVLRGKIGLDVGLRVDVNGAWSLDEARSWLGMLATSGGPELCEQPVPPRQLVRLRDPPLPIAADESLLSADTREEAFRQAPIAAVVLKPMALGGVRITRALARRAAEQGLEVIVTHLHSGPVGHAMACEVALSLQTPPGPCGLDAGPALRAFGVRLPQLRAAWIVRSPDPGLGLAPADLGIDR